MSFRPLHKLILILQLALLPAAMSQPADVTSEAVWEALKVYEGPHDQITNDFDCQGMSIGVGQWNIGKSFGYVKEIVFAGGRNQVLQVMGTFGASFTTALDVGQTEAMQYVRRLQTYKDSSSCDAKKRGAAWTNDGKMFVSELKKLLGSEASKKKQRQLRSKLYDSALANAQKWALANRGAKAEPSLKEITYFLDMVIFNGGGFEKFGLSYKAPSPQETDKLADEALKYLNTADDDFLLHKEAARNNAKFLKSASLSDNERALFVRAYELALTLNASYARQFRLTVINRRAAILFGEAYYSDKDTRPTRIDIKD